MLRHGNYILILFMTSQNIFYVKKIFMLRKYNLKYHENPGPPWSARVSYNAPPNPLVEFAELHAHLPLRGGTNPLTCAPPAILQAPPSAIPTLRGCIVIRA